MRLILASASPRRKELLGLITKDFLVAHSHAEESQPAGLSPAQAVALLSMRKATSVQEQFPEDAILGSDTIVVLEGELLGKPSDEAHAAAMLRRLSGKTHEVYTGVCLLQPNASSQCFSCCARVTFSPLTEEEIAWYIDTKEPADKAGAYGIQGFGARFIEGIEGDYYTVMGLPVSAVYRLLKQEQLMGSSAALD